MKNSKQNDAAKSNRLPEFESGSVFCDPTVDFAFKRIFATEEYKAATIGLLNSFITDHKIVDVEFKNTEIQGETEQNKKIVIDILCKDDKGCFFICEMQKAKQSNFRERSEFYTSKIIAQQITKGQGYDLSKTYLLSFLCFDFDKTNPFENELFDDGKQVVLHYVSREQSSGQVLPGAPEFFFVHLNLFAKKVEEISDSQEMWISLLRNSKNMVEIPRQWRGNEAVKTYFDASNRANFTPEEELQYTKDMITELDIQLSKQEACDKARAEGMEEGMEKGMEKGRKEGMEKGMEKGIEKGMELRNREIAINMLDRGLSVKDISEFTGLSVSEIEALGK